MLTVQAESRDEAVAIVAASIQGLPIEQRESILARTVLIHDPAAWKQLAFSKDNLIFVMDFPGEATSLGRAFLNGHPCIVPLGRADTPSDRVLKLPAISGDEALKALAAMGVEPKKVNYLAGLARSSFSSFRRQIAIAPEVERPKWARPENARSLLPALLAGRWSSNIAGDQAFVASLARKSYDQVIEDYVQWANEDDSPLRCVDTTWYLNSEEDAWMLLGRFLTREDLENFAKLAIKVLEAPDPSFELPDDRRWMGGIVGRKPAQSKILRAGVANTLAIMGATGSSISTTGGANVDDYARHCVRQILDKADWTVWASLPLRVLAEAAPDEFLTAVDRGLTGEAPLLRDIFRDKDETNFLNSATHTDLLFALEILAWSPLYLNQVAIALARLARIDPGGKWGNRPIRSLREIFLLWLPQTEANVEQRFAAIDRTRQAVPDIAWQLLRSLLPKGSDAQSPTAKPRWRDWAPIEDSKYVDKSYPIALRQVVDRMLEDANKNGKRWADLIDRLNYLPSEEFKLVLKGLEGLSPQGMGPSDSADIWDALRNFLSKHRSYPEAKWSLQEAELARFEDLLQTFEPKDHVRQFAWLFGLRPMLPEGREKDWKEFERLIAKRQSESVEMILASVGLTGLEQLLNEVELADRLGSAVARSSITEKVEESLLNTYLKPADRRLMAFLGGLIHSKVWVAGLDWATSKLATVGKTWSASQLAAFCTCLPFNSSTWEIVKDLGETVRIEYWKTVDRFYVEPEHLDAAVRNLVEQKRPSQAISLLGMHVHSQQASPHTVLAALEGLLARDTNNADVRRLSAHDLSDLLEYVSKSPDIDQNRLATLEWALLPALGRHSYSPRVLFNEMATTPSFFAEIVGIAFHAEGEPRKQLSDEERARAERAYELLHSWRFRPLPGMPENGSFDAKVIRDWVLEARDILRKNNRLAVADLTIGEVLSGSPGGDDGAWPNAALRNLIEELTSDDFERGIVLGLLNSEGVRGIDPKDPGKHERETAEKYGKWAEKVTASWGRTGALLRRLKVQYLSSAKREDDHFQLREDLLD